MTWGNPAGRPAASVRTPRPRPWGTGVELGWASQDAMTACALVTVRKARGGDLVDSSLMCIRAVRTSGGGIREVQRKPMRMRTSAKTESSGGLDVVIRLWTLARRVRRGEAGKRDGSRGHGSATSQGQCRDTDGSGYLPWISRVPPLRLQAHIGSPQVDTRLGTFGSSTNTGTDLTCAALCVLLSARCSVLVGTGTMAGGKCRDTIRGVRPVNEPENSTAGLCGSRPGFEPGRAKATMASPAGPLDPGTTWLVLVT